MSSPLNLLNLTFLNNPKESPFNIPAEMTACTAGSGALFIGCIDGGIFKIDRNLQLEPLLSNLKSISYLRASSYSSELLAAYPSETSLSVILIKFDSFSGNDIVQNQPFNLFVKSRSSSPPKYITASSNLTFIAFCNQADEIFVYRSPFNEKAKPAYTLSLPAGYSGITNLHITEYGILYLITKNSSFSCNFLAPRIVFNVIDSSGAEPGFSFLFEDDPNYQYEFGFVNSKTLTVFSNNSNNSNNSTAPNLSSSINSSSNNMNFTGSLNLNSNSGTSANSNSNTNNSSYTKTTYSLDVSVPPSKVGTSSSYIYLALPTDTSAAFRVIDLKYQVMAYKSSIGQRVAFVAHQWDALIIITTDNKIQFLAEYDVQTKISKFCKQERFETALLLAQAKGLGADIIASIHCQQGDLLFNRHDFQGAINHYIETIGFTEPSHVIAKFVEPHQAENLVRYLEALQQRKQATKQHTTLLFNCYTKVGAREMLENIVQKFVDAAAHTEEPTFDVATAIDVLKRNNFTDLAEKIAKAYGRSSLYMQLLYDAQNYGGMIEYMEQLPGQHVTVPLIEYGCEIMDNYPEGRTRLTNFAVKCCTEGIQNRDLKPKEREKRGEKTIIEPIKLSPMFANNDQQHFNFLYQLFKNDPNALKQETWNELIEMALRAKSDEVMALLQHPDAKYSNEQVLVYLTSFGHLEGQALIYEKMKLYSLILQSSPPEKCLEICRKFGEEDQNLWGDALIRISDPQFAKDEKINQVLEEFLDEVRIKKVLPFMTVLKVLKQSGQHTFATVSKLVEETFKSEQSALKEAEKRLQEAKDQTNENKKVINKLTTQNFVLRPTICTSCQREIEKDSNHFLCGHSYHLTCLGESVEFCPLCRERYEKIAKQKLKKMENARDNDHFIQQMEESPDGFDFLLKEIGNSLFSSDINLTEVGDDSKPLNGPKEFLARLGSN